MSFGRFALGFLLVTLLSYGKSQITDYWVPIEFSFFLIFFIIRSSSERRALVFTFLLSLGLDMVLQVGMIKGIPCAVQLVLVYTLMKFMRRLVPNFHEMFLLVFFSVFYIANYYMCMGLSHALGHQIFPYPEVGLGKLIFLAFFHTGFFGLLLLLDLRFSKRGDT